MFVLYQQTCENPFELATSLPVFSPETKSTSTATIQLASSREKKNPVLILGIYTEKKNVQKAIKTLSELWIQSKQVDFVPNLDTHKAFEDYGDGYIQRWRDDAEEKKSILDIYRKDSIVSAGAWVNWFDGMDVKIWKAATFYWEHTKHMDKEKTEEPPSLDQIKENDETMHRPILWEDVMAELRPRLQSRRQAINPIKCLSMPATPLATSPPR